MTPFLAYVHSLSPIALRIGDAFALHWYGLSYLAGFIAGYFVVQAAVKRGKSTLQPDDVSDMVTWLAIGAVAGGRLGYCLFYKRDLFVEAVPVQVFGQNLKLWSVLAINKGGMSSHGGIIGVILATALYARKHKHTFSHLIDLAAIGTPLGLFFGRIANFVNGELLGRPCSEAFPLAVKFPQEMREWSFEQVQQLAPVMKHLNPADVKKVGAVQATIDAIQHGNATVAQLVEPMLTSRHPSQLYEAVMEGLVLFVILITVAWKPRKPLVVGATFCFAYGIVRILCEFFRLPDAHIANEEFAHWGITRGQWLSALLSLLGLGLLIFAQKRNLERMGGLAIVKTPQATESKA